MKKIAAFILLLLTVSSLQAESLQKGLIHLQAIASMEVSNDEIIAQLRVPAHGKQTDKLAEKVNKNTASVLKILKKFPQIKSITTHNSSRPVYRHDKIDEWQISKIIEFEATDFKQMSQLIADIDTLAKVRYIRSHVSKARADEVKEKLTKQAIRNFKAQAAMVSKEFGESDYELVSISVESSGSPPPTIYSVKVSGSIQLSDSAD